ncbi:MAG TPA: hypothetical protein LFW21_02350 [Rickettsia endosymbiont of Pyrocoelia pectoralis]|nr:hypothetical protein [Rickettsia endosymbiont of Pyrocoelia pectoralis]
MKRTVTNYRDVTKENITRSLYSVPNTSSIYNKLSQIKTNYDLIEEEILYEILNKIINKVENSIKLGEKEYILPLINPQLILDLIKITSETHKYFFNEFLPKEDSIYAAMLPTMLIKSQNINIEEALTIVDNAYKKLKFKFDRENNNLESLENLVIFWMLHLQSPLGTCKNLMPQEILSIKQEIYRNILDKVIIPYFTDCFQIIKSTTTHENLDPVDLFDMILLEASSYRNLIAQLQTDPNTDDVGLFTRNSSMRDPVDANPNYIGWKNKITAKIQEALINPDNTEIKLDLDYNQAMCMNLPDNANHLKFGIFHHKDDCKDSNNKNFISACYHFAYLPVENIKDIEPLHITCVHKKFNQSDFRTLANEFKEILFASISNIENLKQKLASFVEDFSKESLFARGQSSIEEMLVKSLAAEKGYSLNWPKAWSLPNNPNYDMQALSEFYKEKFIQNFSDHVILTPIETYLIGNLEIN